MSDMDPCPVCSRDDFGNAGARAQHVRACREKAEQYGGGAPDSSEKAATETVEAAPATDNQNPRGGTEPLADVGENMATGLSATLDEEAPLETRKKGVKSVTSLAGGLLNGIMEYKQKKQQRQEQNARQSGVEPVEDKPECANCGLTFSEIPENAERISCPECGAEYRVV
jgi:hypothetical protein